MGGLHSTLQSTRLQYYILIQVASYPTIILNNEPWINVQVGIVTDWIRRSFCPWSKLKYKV